MEPADRNNWQQISYKTFYLQLLRDWSIVKYVLLKQLLPAKSAYRRVHSMAAEMVKSLTYMICLKDRVKGRSCITWHALFIDCLFNLLVHCFTKYFQDDQTSALALLGCLSLTGAMWSSMFLSVTFLLQTADIITIALGQEIEAHSYAIDIQLYLSFTAKFNTLNKLRFATCIN